MRVGINDRRCINRESFCPCMTYSNDTCLFILLIDVRAFITFYPTGKPYQMKNDSKRAIMCHWLISHGSSSVSGLWALIGNVRKNQYWYISAWAVTPVHIARLPGTSLVSSIWYIRSWRQHPLLTRTFRLTPTVQWQVKFNSRPHLINQR